MRSDGLTQYQEQWWVVYIEGDRGRWFFRQGRGTAKGSIGRWNQDIEQCKVYWTEASARRVATKLVPGVAKAGRYIELKGDSK